MNRGRGAHRQPQVKDGERRAIGFAVYPSGLGGSRSKRSYFAKITHNQVLSEDEVLAEMCREFHIDVDTARFQVGRIFSYLASRIRNGCQLTFGGFTAGLSITGGFAAMNEEFNPEKHKLNVMILPRYELSDAVAYLKPENKTDTVRPRIDSVYSGSGTDGKSIDILVVGAHSIANGIALAIPGGASADGLWLEDLSGKKVAEGTILACSGTRIEFEVAGDIEPGGYDLVVRVPNADGKTFALAKRKVTVAAT